MDLVMLVVKLQTMQQQGNHFSDLLLNQKKLVIAV